MISIQNHWRSPKFHEEAVCFEGSMVGSLLQSRTTSFLWWNGFGPSGRWPRRSWFPLAKARLFPCPWLQKWDMCYLIPVDMGGYRWIPGMQAIQMPEKENMQKGTSKATGHSSCIFVHSVHSISFPRALQVTHTVTSQSWPTVFREGGAEAAEAKAAKGQGWT